MFVYQERNNLKQIGLLKSRELIMNCTKCNTEILEKVKYCPNCGYHLPSLQRDKSTFAVEFLRKAFQKKEKENPVSNESNEKAIALKKERKWGFGWYILGGLVYLGIKQTYKNLGDTAYTLASIGIILSIPIYFYFRNKILNELSQQITRSFLAGLISVILTASTIPVIAYFMQPNIMREVTVKVKAETEKSKVGIDSFLKEDNNLWEFFTDEPTTENEFRNNIKILDKAIPLYKTKDSIVMVMLDNVNSAIIDANNRYPETMSKYPTTSEQLIKLMNKLKIFAQDTQKKYITLKNYYNAHLEDRNNVDEYYEIFSKAQADLDASSKEYETTAKEIQEILENFINLNK